MVAGRRQLETQALPWVAEYGGKPHQRGGIHDNGHKPRDRWSPEGDTAYHSGPCVTLVANGKPINEAGRRLLEAAVSAMREN